MYVACPACKALYSIQSAHLRAAAGELHCGTCGARFNAAAGVFEDAQQALQYAEQQRQGVAREIDALVDRALDQVQEHDQQEQSAAIDPRPARAAPPGRIDEEDDDVDYLERFYAAQERSPDFEPPDEDTIALAVDLDSFFSPEDHDRLSIPGPRDDVFDRSQPPPDADRQIDRDCYAQPSGTEFHARPGSDQAENDVPVPYVLDDDEPDARRGIGWGAIFASLLLIALLGGQFAWHQRYQLAEISELRPAMEQFCALLQCDLPLRHEPERVEMIAREVRDHPTVDGALLINATFVNRAAFRQVWPVFQISFSDVSGTLIAIRRVAPEHYLLAPRPLEQGMAAGEQAHLSLEVIDPGMEAVSFQFEFL
ncbi:MAG: zinc-ribbon and DUF3426 domain-containing protein [Thiogranum sp.]|nr:zinc-ribbon and DUF3426 domain-containing protein [Thiogranum sp.]